MTGRGKYVRTPEHRAKRMIPMEQRIASKTLFAEEDECWEWLASRDRKGYGKLGHALAHRCSYELFVGPIPEGLTLDHLCRNHGCVNPAHLEPVTRLANTHRGPYNPRQTQCKRGHFLTDENVYVAPGTGFRACRQCKRFHDQESKRRKKEDRNVLI